MHYLGRIGDISETRLCGEEMLFEWQIPNFSIQQPFYDPHYDSPSFEFSNACWRFDLYPCKIIADEIPNRLSAILVLTRNPGCPPMTIQYAIAIKGAVEENMRIEKTHEFSNNSSSINFYFPYDKCMNRMHLLTPVFMLIFSCHLRRVAPNSAGGGEELQKSLQKLLQSGEDSDVILKVQGKEFRAHRAILRMRSPVFEAMFTHDMVEKQKGVVTIQDCDSEYFSDFLQHVYTGSVEISMSNVVSLYTSSDKYDVSTLKKACTEFMIKYLTVASFCNTMTLAVKHGEKDLIEWATAFFCDNSLEIVETAEWQTFLLENPTVANDLFIKKLKFVV